MYNLKTGRQLTDKERQAMFFYMNNSKSVPKLTLKKKKFISDKSNRFAIGLALPVNRLATSGVGSSVGSKMIPVSSVPIVGSNISPGSSEYKTLNTVKKDVVKVGNDVGKVSKGVISSVGGVASNLGSNLAEDVFGPQAMINSELAQHEDIWTINYPIPEFSESPISYSLDVETARAAIKKQYPEADVNTKVTVLSPEKYMETALKKNPGREDEAMRSNGFYSPSDDKTYIEYDQDKLNTLRALLHEFVHDMSDEGVDNVQLNEGYADYVAYKIMTQEIKIPEGKAKLTLGYPKEMSKIAKLVQDNGREKVDEAFLKEHSLKKLDVKLDF